MYFVRRLLEWEFTAAWAERKPIHATGKETPDGVGDLFVGTVLRAAVLPSPLDHCTRVLEQHFVGLARRWRHEYWLGRAPWDAAWCRCDGREAEPSDECSAKASLQRSRCMADELSEVALRR